MQAFPVLGTVDDVRSNVFCIAYFVIIILYFQSEPLMRWAKHHQSSGAFKHHIHFQTTSRHHHKALLWILQLRQWERKHNEQHALAVYCSGALSGADILLYALRA